MANVKQILRRIASGVHRREDLVALLGLRDEAEIEAVRAAAFEQTTRILGDAVYYRGIVEFSNVCALDCLYCGIRRGNREVARYTLTEAQVVEAALWCGEVGYGSCVLQAGERSDPAFVDYVESCVRAIKARSRSEALPEGLGITLSVGEQSLETYKRWFDAGAHRYLLRIETTQPELFASIHPEGQTLERRLECLGFLREAGYQVGTGVMIGLPGQTLEDLADDILFFERQDVDMIGMGPYIVHAESPMRDRGMMPEADLLRLAFQMIAVTRLTLPYVNIASTTALQALLPDGRERGITFGANVTMPNLTPKEVRPDYQLYEGKPCIDEGRAECRGCLQGRVESTGRRVGWDSWGDALHFERRRAAEICPAARL